MTILLLLFCNILLAIIDIQIGYTSIIERNSKLYVYEPIDFTTKTASITIYYLTDGRIDQFKNTIKKIENVPDTYSPQFLNLPQGLPNGRSEEIWMIGGQKQEAIKSQKLDSERWTGKFVNDTELKFDSSFIPQPNFPNFPKGGFSQTIVTYNNVTSLYIIGGFIYDLKSKDTVFSSCVFKYDFNSSNWSDLSHTSKSILPPIATHRTVLVNDFLLVGIGLSPSNLSSNQTSNPEGDIKTNAIEKLYKFDLQKKTWSIIMPKTNLNRDIYDTGLALGASLDLYNGRIVTYAALKNFDYDGYSYWLGYLDIAKSQWEWSWYEVKTDNGQDNNLFLQYHQSHIINNQLLLIHGISNQNRDKMFTAINLDKKVFAASLNYTGYNTPSVNNNNNDSSPNFPSYLIAIIIIVSVIAIILLILAVWFYLRYKKRKLEDDKGQKMQEVWAGESAAIKDDYVSKNGNPAIKDSLGWNRYKNTQSNNYDTTIANSGSTTIDYSYFQHEVDLNDMQESKNSQLR